jgi:hypothetical protein
MIINNAKDAQRYINTGIGAGYIRLAVEGLEMSSAIMYSARDRYSADRIMDMREAIGALRLQYFRMTGKAVV